MRKNHLRLNFVLVGGGKNNDNSSFRGDFANNVNNLLTDLRVK